MSLLDALRNLIHPRAITPAQLFSTGQDDWYASRSGAGIHVTTRLAMEAALGACVRLLADDISSLPVDVLRKVGRDVEPLPLPSWLVSPSGRPWDTHTTLISDIVVSLGTDGNAFLLATPSVWDVERLEVLDPDSVEVLEGPGLVEFRVGGRTMSDGNIVHIPWVRQPGRTRGLDVVELARETTGLELAAREWAGRFFGHGATLGGIIELPGARPSTEEADELRKQFALRHQGRQRSHLFGVLYGGAKYQPTSLKPQEAELAPLWQHVLEEACRTYHIPPHLMASQDPGGSSYSSVEQRSIEYVVHAVTTFTTRIERPLSRLIPGADTFLKLSVNGLLRGDIKSRAEAEALWLDKKVLRREEVRAVEDFPYIGELGWLETPNNNAPDPVPAAEPERALNLSVHDAPVTVAPELRIDSVQVAEAGIERIADAATSGIAAGVAILGDALAQDARSVTDSMGRIEVTLRDQMARTDALAGRFAALEAREAARAQPVHMDLRRDEQGRTTAVYVRQGERVTRRTVRHDEQGRVIGIAEEAVA